MPAQSWKYQPRAARELKERLAFTAASQRAASVAAEGKPYSAALAQREMVLSGNNPEARANLLRNRQQTGQKALQFLNPAYERRAQAFDSITGGAEGEALPALPDASGGEEGGGLLSAIGNVAGAAGNAAGNALEAGFRHLSRPHGALLGALTGDNPRDSAQQLAEGWRDPDRFSASDVGFARHLPEGSLQRRALGFGLSEAADPANLVIAAKGASIAGKLPRFAGALLEPISKGGFGQRLGGELALSTGAQAGAAALQPLTSQLPEGAQLPVNLAGALLAGGVTGAAYSRAPRALDPSNLRSPIELDARLNPRPMIAGGSEGPVLGPVPSRPSEGDPARLPAEALDETAPPVAPERTDTEPIPAREPEPGGQPEAALDETVPPPVPERPVDDLAPAREPELSDEVPTVSRETVDEVRAEVPQASESGPAPVGPARTPPESQPSPSEALIDHAAGIEEASRLPAEAPPPPSTEPPSPRPPTTGPAAPLHRTPSRLDRAAIASAALRFGTGPDGLAKLKELYGREFGDDVVDSTARRAEADQRARAERTAAAGGGGDEPPRPPDAAEQPDAFDDMDREMGINRNVRPGSEFSGADAELARQAESLIDQSVPNALEKMRESSGARRRAVGTAGGRALRAGKSFFNPSAGMNNRNHTSWSAAQSVRAQVSTVGGVIEAQQLKPLLEALERDPPRYIGPEDFPEEYRGTLNDLGDHPPDHPTDPHYESFSPDVERLMVEYNAARESAIDFSNSSFGTEWGKFTTPGQKLFMSIIEKTNIEDNVDAIIQEVSEYRPSRRSKERTFASLYERWRWETDKAAETGGTVPEFEVDPIKAHEVWMSSLAQDAANSTFRRGVERQAALPQRRAGGEVDMPALTPAQALAREQPQLMAKYNGASAQFREAKRLFRTAERRGQSEEMARWAAEMEQATAVLDDLRPTLQSARLGDLVKNKVTNLYHSRADNAQIERLHQNSFQGVFRVADEFRANVLVMDASVATIQGAVAFFASPVTVTRSLPDAIKHLRDLDSYNNWIKQKQESGVIDRWHSAGGGTLHQQEAEFRPQGIERIPLLGKGVREVNDALWRAVNTFSLEMFEQDSAWLRKQFPDAPQSVLDSASRSVANQLVPRISPGQTGRSQRRAAQERLVMVSPSFAMQPFNAVFGSARGAAALAEQALAKLALHRGADSEAWIKLRPRDQLALRRVSTLAAGTMALSVASAVLSAEANKQSVEDAIAEVMNPQSGRFMSIVLGNEGSIPLGSAYRSVFRLFAAVERDGWQWPERGLSGFLRSKLAPAVRVGFDQVRGEDYFGRPIDEHFGEHTLLSRLFYAGTGAVPIVAQEAALSPLEGRSPREAAVNTVAQLAGANYYGRRPQEEWDRKARAMFGHSANGLERHELQKLKDTYPGLWSDVVITRSEEQQNYEDAKELMRTRQELDDQSLLSGEKTPREWRDQWRTRSAELRAVGEVLFGEREYTVEERDDLLKDDPFRAYIATIALNENEAGNVAWNAVDLWREKLTDDQRAAIDRNTGLGGTPMVRTYRQLESLRKRYLDIPTYRLGWTGLSGPKQADLGRAIDRLYSEIAATRPDAWGARGEERAAALREAYSGFPRDRAAVIAENAGISEQHLIRGVASRIQGTLESNTGREAFIADNPDYLLFWGSRPLNDDQRTRLRQLYRKQWLKLEQTREAA